MKIEVCTAIASTFEVVGSVGVAKLHPSDYAPRTHDILDIYRSHIIAMKNRRHEIQVSSTQIYIRLGNL